MSMSNPLSDATAVRFMELERRLSEAESRLAVLEDLDDRVDGHDKDIEEIRVEVRGMRRDLSRVLDAQTSHGLVLEKIHASQEHLVRLLTPTVAVTE